MEDGSKFRKDGRYTISYIGGAFPQGRVNGTETGITMTDAFREYIRAEKLVAPDSKRMRIIH